MINMSAYLNHDGYAIIVFEENNGKYEIFHIDSEFCNCRKLISICREQYLIRKIDTIYINKSKYLENTIRKALIDSKISIINLIETELEVNSNCATITCDDAYQVINTLLNDECLICSKDYSIQLARELKQYIHPTITPLIASIFIGIGYHEINVVNKHDKYSWLL